MTTIVCSIPEHDNIVHFNKQVKFHFKKQGGKLVCEVEDPQYIDFLLAMPEMSLLDPGEVLVPDSSEDDGQGEAITGTPYDQQTIEELRAAYQAAFGRAAPPAIKHGTLVRKLVEHDALTQQ